MTSPAYALSWLVPETHSARVAGIRAYWDDPLNLALARRQVCKAGLHDMNDETNRVDYRRGCAACHRDYNAAWWRRHGAEKRRR